MSGVRTTTRGEEERGVVLVLVLFVLLAVVALALSLGRDVRVEVHLAVEKADALRLRSMVDSAIDRALAELRLDDVPGDTLASSWRDNEALFSGVELDEGRFWLLLSEPDPGDGRELRYGIRDEGSKLNVNAANRDQLLALPGITEEAVDGILDWRDEDDEVREFGAESGYYASLDPPYTAKNQTLESLEELLRIKGIDEAMLYGEDRNRNGLLDPGEDDGDGSFPPDDADGTLDRGLVDYLSVFTRELNRTSDNRARLNFNSASKNEIRQRLDAAQLEAFVRNRVVNLKDLPQEIGSLGELVLRVGSTDATAVGILLNELSLTDSPVIPGRININTAAREVVLGLPGLEEEQVEAILTQRLDFSLDQSSPAWLLNVLSLQQFAQVVDLVGTRSDQFTVQALVLLNDRPRFRRVEVFVDRSFAPVRIFLRKDLTALGFPLPNERGEELP